MTAWPMTARRWGEPAMLRLAAGERIIWCGAPAWRAVAKHLFRVPWVAAYFTGLTLVDMAITRTSEGTGWPVVYGAAPTVISGGGCVAILLTLSWAVQRTTRYVLTTERIVMQFGIALPATLSIPLHKVSGCSVRVRRDHVGDLGIALKEHGKLSMAKLWPHARPWRRRAPEPMLRDIPRAGEVAPLLCRALAAAQEAETLVPRSAAPPPRDSAASRSPTGSLSRALG